MTVHNLKVSRPKSNGTIANYFYNLNMADPECPAVITKSMVFIDDDGLHYVDNEGVDTIVDDLVGADVVYLDRAIVFDGRPNVKQARG